MILIKHFRIDPDILYNVKTHFRLWNDQEIMEEYRITRSELPYFRKIIGFRFDPDKLDKILEDSPDDFSELDIKGLKANMYRRDFSDSFTLWLSFQE